MLPEACMMTDQHTRTSGIRIYQLGQEVAGEDLSKEACLQNAQNFSQRSHKKQSNSVMFLYMRNAIITRVSACWL